MDIDFSPLFNQTITAEHFAAKLTKGDLRRATTGALDWIRDVVKGMTDAQLTHVPNDPNANDTFAASEDEKHIGWSLAHLVLHVTASAEEYATFAALVARGIEVPAGIRLRYEQGWREVTTKTQVLARIEESRRMLLALLDTWPDEPQLTIYRKYLEGSPRFGQKINAIASHMLGLSHLASHIEQIKHVAAEVSAPAQTA